MEKYNVELYSHIALDGLHIPIHIHISKIKEHRFYSILEKRIVKYDAIEENMEVQQSHFFYGKFEKRLNAIKILKIIYEFVDYSSMEDVGFDLYKVIGKTEKEFIEFGMCISWDDILFAYTEILHYIKCIREEFMQIAIESLSLDKEYPEIKSKNSYEKSKAYREHKDSMSLPYEIINIDVHIMEGVIFKENLNKSASEYSWRELELKRLHTTAKHLHENFVESVRSKIMEELTDIKEG